MIRMSLAGGARVRLHCGRASQVCCCGDFAENGSARAVSAALFFLLAKIGLTGTGHNGAPSQMRAISRAKVSRAGGARPLRTLLDGSRPRRIFG